MSLAEARTRRSERNRGEEKEPSSQTSARARGKGKGESPTKWLEITVHVGTMNPRALLVLHVALRRIPVLPTLSNLGTKRTVRRERRNGQAFLTRQENQYILVSNLVTDRLPPLYQVQLGTFWPINIGSRPSRSLRITQKILHSKSFLNSPN